MSGVKRRWVWLICVGFLFGVAAIVLWPRQSKPYGFLEGLNYKGTYRNTVGKGQFDLYEGPGDFDAVCAKAAPELKKSGWRKVERYHREERWDSPSQDSLLIREAIVDFDGYTMTIDGKAGVVSVELPFREESILERLRRIFHL